ncbi:MAG: alcohol dehydrogenase catalytic domain-containing protein [Chloroflexi bacterium]|jgi:L-iditol 2-dehydrogenase|nr:alcohol dehydrogenase catalytic domain-containing protein [Chloroflexota bacterium]MBT4754791.1 alcohol dehydrogenase catalytic domain-containing protein [Chloroflexota bacterium]MBT5337068.1 alcohol dehydrogenase catalytic domain-containing protein [Chloroflexota bacterium]MBT6356561.1 alcohol dehydrogenase catalytic domain-containing protein [Chloroflexota bacterium]MBT6989910.1 alcohol dehydrogenase catalytic domain-containing protein [Chloroflexota bacterium]
MHIPEKMKAAVLFDLGDLRVTEVPVPQIGAGEVLVKVEAVAICGSDPGIINKGWKGYPILGEFIPGHEFTGTVVKVAPDVFELKEGDRVAVEPHKGCGRCENCLKGLYTTCLNYGNYELGHRHYGFSTNGGYADFAACHVTTLHKLHDSIGFDEGTMLTGAGTVLYGYERIGWVGAGETVVVTGPGAIGLMSAHIAKILGAGRVILTGTRENRLAVGRELGADITINVREENVVDRVMELTDGVGADLVVECTGQSAPAAEVLDFIRKNGRISFNGIYHDPVTLQLDKIVQWNLLITGPKAEGKLNLKRAIPLMADGRMDFKPLITHHFKLDEINEAFDTFNGRIGGSIKVIINP